jgi:phosphatidylinositol alpha-1,6-mannosyltransferase
LIEVESKPPASNQVLLFSFNYPPKDGGISRGCAELVSGLQRRGIGIQVLSQQGNRVGSYIPKVPEKRVTTRRPLRELAALRKLRHCGPNGAIICGIWYPEGLVAALAGARPLVILVHGLELKPTRQRWRRGVWRGLAQLVLHRASVVVANSGYTAELARTVARGARVAAVPPGIDHHRFCPGDQQSARRRFAVPEHKRVITTVSRILSHKGHRIVFKALASMPEVIRNKLVYLVAGQGRDMKSLQQEAEALGLGEVVRWLGYTPEADLPDLYRSADLFLLCTREDPNQPNVEGFGLAFLEAQSCGIPVVGSRTGGISDAVKEGAGGWLVDQDDVGAIAAILSHLVERSEDFRVMGLAARQRVERECTSEQYIDRFVETLNRHGVLIG